MRRILYAVPIMLTSVAIGQDVTVVTRSRHERMIQLRSTSLSPPTRAQGRSFDVDLIYPASARKALGYVNIIFDPVSGQAAWLHEELSRQAVANNRRRHTFKPDEFTGSYTPYMTPDGIVLASVTSSQVSLIPFRVRARSIDEAEALAIQSVREGMNRNPRRLLGPKPVVIGLRLLGLDFLLGPAEVVPAKPIRLVSFARLAAEQWEVIVECRWKERLVLDREFRLVSHSKIP